MRPKAERLLSGAGFGVASYASGVESSGGPPALAGAGLARAGLGERSEPKGRQKVRDTVALVALLSLVFMAATISLSVPMLVQLVFIR